MFPKHCAVPPLVSARRREWRLAEGGLALSV